MSVDLITTRLWPDLVRRVAVRVFCLQLLLRLLDTLLQLLLWLAHLILELLDLPDFGVDQEIVDVLLFLCELHVCPAGR